MTAMTYPKLQTCFIQRAPLVCVPFCLDTSSQPHCRLRAVARISFSIGILATRQKILMQMLSYGRLAWSSLRLSHFQSFTWEKRSFQETTELRSLWVLTLTALQLRCPGWVTKPRNLWDAALQMAVESRERRLQSTSRTAESIKQTLLNS